MQCFDSHIHSNCSFDARDTIPMLCQSAIHAGLTGISITDHCDIGDYQIHDWKARLAGSLEGAKQAGVQFADKLMVTRGIELGQALHDKALSETILAENTFDFVLCSLHNLSGEKDITLLDFSSLADNHALLTRYFAELYQHACWGNFDALSHLTYPCRYIAKRGAPMPDIRDFEEILTAIFKQLAENGKGIEINVSGFRHDIGKPLPALWELTLFKRCGGEFVTIGSDAHRANVVGAHIDKGLALLKEAGFAYQTFYKDRKPVLYPL